MSIKTKVQILTASSALLLSILSPSVAFSATEFKIAVSGSQGGGQYIVAQEFADQLKASTDGDYTATLFLNSQLGGEQSTVNDTALGMLDMTIVATNNISPFSPILGILSLPYLIKTEEEALKITQSDYMQNELIDQVAKEAGVRIVAWDYTGFRAITNSKKPVKNLKDLQSLKMRVPKSKVLIETWNSWGMNPSPMDWNEVYTALQQKVVDGQALPIYEVYTENLSESQNHLSKAHYNYLLQPLVISEAIFQKQPAEIQEKILEAGRKASLKNNEHALIKEKEAEEKLIEAGVQIISDMDESEMQELAVNTVWPKYYSTFGKENIQKILKSLGRENEELP